MKRKTSKGYTDPANASTILEIVPEVLPTPYGWLAVSPREAPLRIGVQGATEEAARDEFQVALSAWASLREEPDPWG